MVETPENYGVGTKSANYVLGISLVPMESPWVEQVVEASGSNLSFQMTDGKPQKTEIPTQNLRTSTDERLVHVTYQSPYLSPKQW